MTFSTEHKQSQSIHRFHHQQWQEIIKTGGFLAEMVHDDLIKITITTTDHGLQILYLPIHSAGKEQP